MQITEAKFTNLKGLTVTEQYGPETLIVGSNFKGKTARLQGILLAVLGYIPGLPRTNPGIFQLSSGPFMSVDVWGKDFSIGRMFKKAGRSIERTDNVPEAFVQTESLITALDSSAFLSATGPEKLAMIFRLAQIDTKETRESILAKLPADLTYPEATEDGNVRDWIAAALEAAKQGLSYAKQAVDRLAKTQQGMAALEPETVPVVPADIDAQLTALEDEKKPIQARIMEIGILSKNYDAAKASYDRALAAYNRNTAARTEKEALVKSKGPHVISRETEETWLSHVKRPDMVRLRADLRDAQGSVNKFNGIVDNAEKAKAAAQKSIDEINALECCPHCKSKGKGWKKELLATVTNALENAEAQAVDAAAHLKQAETIYTAHETAVAEAETLQEEIKEHEGRLNAAVEALRRITDAERDLANEITAPTAPAAPDDTVEEEMNLDRELEDITGKIDALKSTKEAAEQVKARNATTSQAALAAEKATAEKENWQNAVAILEETRAKMVSDAIKALLIPAERVYSGILTAPLVYEDGAIGLMRNGRLDAMAALSGTEQLIVTMSLQVALGAKSAARIVILDEMGRLDVANKNKLVTNLHGMVADKVIDQWIGVDVSEPTKSHKAITVIEA